MPHTPKETGNALFLILIAVALFAALSYAITQSGRGGGSISREQALIAASQVTQYGAYLRNGFQRMILQGTPAYEIEIGMPDDSSGYCMPSNTSGDTEAKCLFLPQGGGLSAQCPSAEQLDATVGVTPIWRFRNIPRQSGLGYFIKDIGTNTNITGRDAFALLRGVRLAVCQQINKSLGLTETPADSSDFSFVGGGGENYDISSNVIYSNPGEAFACFDHGGGEYDYYHALVEQ